MNQVTEKNYALISCQDLRRIIPFRAINDARYYLSGIKVEPTEDGCRLIATNGHMIAVTRSIDSDVKEPFILQVNDYLCEAIRHERFDAGYLRIRSKESHAELLITSHVPDAAWIQAGPAFIDDTYPDWQKVIPTDESTPGILAEFNPEYLSRALALFSESGKKVREPVRLYQKDANAALLIRGYDMIVALMPMRLDHELPAIADWMTQ